MTRTLALAALLAWPMYACSDALAPIIVPFLFHVWGIG
jgi:hypothetical protein